MTNLLEYGEVLGDNSINTAVVQNGYREPDTPEQGQHYLENIKDVISRNEADFKGLTFPKDLEDEATGMLGEGDNPQWVKFVNDLSKAWGNAEKARKLLRLVQAQYVPRGVFNAHATGYVFDLNFTIFHHVYADATKKKTIEVSDPVNAKPIFNQAALRSATGTWLNQFALKDFNFDSYNQGVEIWHMEWRGPK